MTRIVIDYETDPDFSLLDESDLDRCVSLCTCLYDGDRLIGSLGDSQFIEDADDWTIGTFATVDDIPARCPHLREVAAELIREANTHKEPTMTEDEREEVVDNATTAALDLIARIAPVPVDEWLDLNNYLIALVRRLDASANTGG